MPTKYGDIWRKVRLSVPGADPFLVRSWVDDAYRKLTHRRQWQWRIYQDQLVWTAPQTIAVTVTLGSPDVTSAALFTSDMVGRSLRVGNGPIYTITTFIDASNLSLELPYGNAASVGAQDATVFDGYATMPARFGAFIVILDNINQHFVPWWMTQDELAILDPARSSTDSGPRLLCAASPSPVPATLGQIRYEYWPRPSAAGVYGYFAASSPAPPRDDEFLKGVLADRSDVLEHGALAQAARWPGTATYRNPYFNLALSTWLDKEFDELSLQLDLRDDDQAQQSIQTVPWHRWNAYTWAYDTRFLQATDATLSDYWGGGGYAWSSYWP